jgi:hypothetical protein
MALGVRNRIDVIRPPLILKEEENSLISGLYSPLAQDTKAKTTDLVQE